MNKLPSLDPGTVVKWQELHRTVRLEFAALLLGRRIAYRTWVGVALNADFHYLTIDRIDTGRARSNGHDRAFIGVDEHGQMTQLPWNRIVEVVL